MCVSPLVPLQETRICPFCASVAKSCRDLKEHIVTVHRIEVAALGFRKVTARVFFANKRSARLLDKSRVESALTAFQVKGSRAQVTRAVTYVLSLAGIQLGEPDATPYHDVRLPAASKATAHPSNAYAP